ncbi:MAG TPA: M23 family metallopeptidase [Dehalococcoidia bacterium]|nr:M23 family metallopeptidase [Dehalococcoidia bacterium]
MTFLVSAVAVAVTVVAALIPSINLPGTAGGTDPKDLYPAPPGYLLPWPGGEIHSVTQGEETPFTHNGAAAYAFDFDLTYETVVAARSGKVTMLKEDSNAGGCNSSFSSQTNYVVIDHGDGTSAVYMHLAQDGVEVNVGDVVEQGQPIAISGETGVTCSDDDAGPGPHLHFQVERTVEGQYFAQSLPIAFDDISRNDGVPQDGESYVSGNYGRGKPQKIKLTPHRVPREFNPVAQPLNPDLAEAVAPPPAADAPPVPTDTPAPEGLPPSTPSPSSTVEPDDTATPVPTDTPAPEDTATPVPPPPSPTATETPAPPPPTPTDTPAGIAAQQTAPPDTPTPTPTDTPTAVASAPPG